MVTPDHVGHDEGPDGDESSDGDEGPDVLVLPGDTPLLRPLRSAGLVAGGAMDWMQGWLVGGAMGYRGDVPALCRKVAA